ncbi:hypothetical protein PO656_16360, partial [Enterobacter kobei]
LMMSLWDALRMNMMISYQELVRTFPNRSTLTPHLQNQAPALVSLISYLRHNGAFALFLCRVLCRAFGYISIGGRGRIARCVGVGMTGKTNSVQFTTRKIGLFGGGI